MSEWILIIWIFTTPGVAMSTVATFQDHASCEEAGIEWTKRSRGNGLLQRTADFEYHCMHFVPAAEKEFPK